MTLLWSTATDIRLYSICHPNAASNQLTGDNAGVLVLFYVSLPGPNSGRLGVSFLDGVVEFQLEQNRVFAPANTVLLKVTNRHWLGVKAHRSLVVFGCNRKKRTITSSLSRFSRQKASFLAHFAAKTTAATTGSTKRLFFHFFVSFFSTKYIFKKALSHASKWFPSHKMVLGK